MAGIAGCVCSASGVDVMSKCRNGAAAYLETIEMQQIPFAYDRLSGIFGERD